ncbi:hypothetical protein L9F63_012163, partial [Diploptera punctata]
PEEVWLVSDWSSDLSEENTMVRGEDDKKVTPEVVDSFMSQLVTQPQTRKPYECFKCGASYSMKKNLQSHMSKECSNMFQISDRHSSDELLFLSNENNLNTDTVLETEEIEYWNTKKVSSVLTTDCYDAGEQNVTTETFDCIFCGKIYPDQKKLSAHQRKDCGSGPRYQCPSCSVSIRRRDIASSDFWLTREDTDCNSIETRSSERMLYSTYNTSQCNSRYVSVRAYQCNVCGRSYSNMKHLTAHIRRDCAMCFDYLSINSSGPWSLNDLSPAHVCTRCGKLYKRKSSLRNHVRDECGREPQSRDFEDTESWESSWRNIHLLMNKMGQKTIETEENPLMTVSSHSGTQLPWFNADKCSFTCEKCGKKYKWKGSLRNHMRLECGKEPQFHCHICPHKTYQKGNLTRHMTVSELDGLTLEYIINLEESRNWNMNSDTMTQTGLNMIENSTPEQPLRAYICIRCGRSYSQKQGLNFHMKWECGKEPQFFCRICSYKTVRKGNLSRHMILTQFKCAKCYAGTVKPRFKLESVATILIFPNIGPELVSNVDYFFLYLVDGMALDRLFGFAVSGNWNQSIVPIGNNVRQIPAYMPVKAHKCDKCGKAYARKQGLFNHVKWECGKEPQFF